MVDELAKAPPMGEVRKMRFQGDQAMELFQTANDRNGRYVLEAIHTMAWRKEGQPMYRGIPRMMPFELRVDKVLWNYQEFTISVEYHFSDRRS